MHSLVGLSGGIDSAHALETILEQGVTASALTLVMQCGDALYVPDQDSLVRARELCESLGVSHIVKNVAPAFKEHVTDPFIAEYSEGRTPSPCILCNRFIKVRMLVDTARALGADRIVTGHYAHKKTLEGRDYIARGDDRSKDQSYFLCALDSEQVAMIEFPLAHTSKQEISTGERGAVKESQDVCFLSGTTVREFIASQNNTTAITEGNFVTAEGAVIGKHSGIVNYTIGQRKGLGLGGGPWYVKDIDTEHNNVVISKEKPLTERFAVKPVQDFLSAGFLCEHEATVQIRSRGKAYPAHYAAQGDTIGVIYLDAGHVVAPGQYAAFYADDILLGGAVIERREDED